MKKKLTLNNRSNLNMFLSVFLIIILISFSCRQTNTTHQPNGTKENIQETSLKKNIIFVSPAVDEVFKTGQLVNFRISFPDSSIQPDSIQFLINGKRFNAIRKLTEAVSWNTIEAKVGQQNIEALAYFGANAAEQGNIKIRLVPGQQVINYTYGVLNTYPHDPTAYTQGLIILDNYFYESTGQYGQSTIRKVKSNTGDVMQVFKE
jgi:hypothetical protein